MLKEVIDGCLKNDRQKQGELYRMFASRMYGICLRYTGNTMDAQDILQEGFVKIFSSMKQFNGQGSFEGWMKRIFINMALDKYRSRITHLSVDDLNDDNTGLKDSEASAIEMLSEKEILNAIRNLPDQYRLVFNLYILEGMSHHEIAEMLNIGVSTSRSNLARAKTLLKGKIEYYTHWIEKAI